MEKTGNPDRNTANSSSKLTANSFVIMAIRLAGPGGSLLFWAIAARMITVDDLGVAGAILAAATFLTNLAQLGMGYGLIKYVPASKDPGGLINLTFEVVVLIATVLVLIFVAGIQYWSPELAFIQSSWPMVMAFLLLVVCYGLAQLLNSVFLARRNPIYSLYKNSLQTVSSILIFIPLATRMEGYWAVLIAYLLSIGLSLLVSVIVFLPRSETDFRLHAVFPRDLHSQFGSYAFLNYVSDQFIRAPASLILILITNLLGPATSGFFFVAWTISRGLLSLVGAVSRSFLAEGSSRPATVTALARQSLKLGLTIALGFSVFAIVFSKPLLAIFGQEYVVNSLVPLRILALSIVPTAFLTIFYSMLRIRGVLKPLIVMTAVGMGSSLLSTYAFASWYGLNGAALGWLLAQLVLAGAAAIIWKTGDS